MESASMEVANEDSLVVTHPTTNSPACGLSTAERTGSPIFHTLWSYVIEYVWKRLRRNASHRAIGYTGECPIDRA
ncbi:hypothetical protein N7519_006234 [Penicillium mononematosum]|uniref:uncharacterized protein n=1 Tax=Penicillium mononematosum TaxID=268346 RepID=UPI002546D2AF|nr:uncharacterized protein N7519_006234 [Penicillium mononematosum]KAJ6184933.1 hypothetical protein N7519_006234 [Penicillium mononematosum]